MKTSLPEFWCEADLANIIQLTATFGEATGFNESGQAATNLHNRRLT